MDSTNFLFPAFYFLQTSVIQILPIIIISVCVLAFFYVHKMIGRMVEMRVEELKIPEDLEKEIQKVQVETRDGLKINSWNLSPENPRGVLIMLHGMHMMDGTSMLEQGKIFWEKNWEVFSIDLRAHGHSEGKEIGVGYTEIWDVEAIINWIKSQDRLKNKKISLFGFSMGGSTAINAAANLEAIDKIISVSGFARCEDIYIHFIDGKMPGFLVSLSRLLIRLSILLRYKVRPLKGSPLYNISRIKPRPVLLIHGDADQDVPIEQAYRLKEKGGEYVELIVLKGKGHDALLYLFSWEDVRRDIYNFLEQD